MTKSEKQQIESEIKRLSDQLSQNRIAKRVGVSAATISQIVNGNWGLIKDEMWRKIKVKLRIDFDWKIAQTTLYSDLADFLNKAKERHATVAFSHQAGTGKSTLYGNYAKAVPNVIYLEGTRTMSKKTYAKTLLINAGQDSYGTTEELLERFVDYVSELESPLIILDQFDKLKENTFDLFMDLYNSLQGHCGFVISGAPALEERIRRGVQRKRIGYEEIWSRMDRKFIKLYPVSLQDVRMIFQANGVNDETAIMESFNTSEGDLRRVRKDVLKCQIKTQVA